MKILILSLSLIYTTISFAGLGHGHSHGKPSQVEEEHKHPHGGHRISEVKTFEIAKLHIKRLIKAKKLPETWESATYVKSDEKKFSGKSEWVVTFDNEKGETDKKKLFIFLKLTGEFIAANFTGK